MKTIYTLNDQTRTHFRKLSALKDHDDIIAYHKIDLYNHYIQLTDAVLKRWWLSSESKKMLLTDIFNIRSAAQMVLGPNFY